MSTTTKWYPRLNSRNIHLHQQSSTPSLPIVGHNCWAPTNVQYFVGNGLPCLKLGQTSLPRVVTTRGRQEWHPNRKGSNPNNDFPTNHHFVEFQHILATLGRKVLLQLSTFIRAYNNFKSMHQMINEHHLESLCSEIYAIDTFFPPQNTRTHWFTKTQSCLKKWYYAYYKASPCMMEQTDFYLTCIYCSMLYQYSASDCVT